MVKRRVKAAEVGEAANLPHVSRRRHHGVFAQRRHFRTRTGDRGPREPTHHTALRPDDRRHHRRRYRDVMPDTGAQRLGSRNLLGSADDFLHREVISVGMLPVQQRRGDPGFVGDSQLVVHGFRSLPACFLQLEHRTCQLARALPSPDRRRRLASSPAAVEYGRTAMSSSPDRRRRLASSPASAPPKGGSATPSGTSADDAPSSRCRPFHSPSRSHVQPLCCRFRARLPHSANVHRRTFAPLGLLLFRTRQTRPSPFGCYGSGYSTFALNQDAPSAASYIVTVPPP